MRMSNDGQTVILVGTDGIPADGSEVVPSTPIDFLRTREEDPSALTHLGKVVV